MPPRVRTPPGRLVLALAGVAVVLGVAVAAPWLAVGGRWLRMDTPSMGTAAPVGSLLWVRPVPLDDVEVGDLVTVRPDGAAAGTTYTHRVRAVDGDVVRTAGDLSGPDPWRIDEAHLVGRVERVWPVAGTVVRVLPLLTGLLVLTAVATGRLRPDLRLPARLVGVALALSVVLVVHRPLSDARMLAFDAGEDGARTTWVNAGQVPLRLRAPATGRSAVMGPGETASIEVSRTDAAGRYLVTVRPELPDWAWWLVGGVWVVPALGATLRARRGVRPA